MGGSLKRQALILTAGNGLTRALGFALHLVFARMMGAEALGVMELSHSVSMLALTPVTAGLPTAMSRMTAGRPAADQPNVLRAGLRLVTRIALAVMPLLLILSPALGWMLGDARAVPAIWSMTPCVLLLGLCSVYSGYCYGRANTLTPAANECVEQTVRFALSVLLLLWLGGRSIALSAALPGVAECVAAGLSLWLFRRAVRLPRSLARPSRALMREATRLTAPVVLSRLCLTGMRTLNAVLLPACLRRSGLTASAATAQFGLLNGMAMPLMMLPGIVTGAVCMVATPAVSRLESQPRRMKAMMRQLALAGLGIGAAASVVLWLGADFVSGTLYRQEALAPLIRLLAPVTAVMALNQVMNGMIAGLGLQRRSLTGTVLSAAAVLLMTAWLAPLPGWRLFGAALATMTGQTVTLLWNGGVLLRALRRLRRQPARQASDTSLDGGLAACGGGDM